VVKTLEYPHKTRSVLGSKQVIRMLKWRAQYTTRKLFVTISGF